MKPPTGKPAPAWRNMPPTTTPKAQAKAMAGLAQAQRSKALAEYGDAMKDDPTTTDCKIALERFILAFRAEHEAMCDVYRAMMAEAER